MPAPHPAPVRSKSGSEIRLPWLGFLFESSLAMVAGLGLGYGKILAHEVTQGDGLVGGQWYRLAPGEYVLGWRSNRELFGGHIEVGIHGLLSDDGWPVVMGPSGRAVLNPQKPKLMKVA